MLTIQPIKDANEAAGYYSNHDNYYLSDKESLKDSSAWLGKGSEILGLRGAIEEKQFLGLLQGKLPSGEELGIEKNGKKLHRPGTDVTLSAPKSVSILALAGKDERLVDAHQKAVKAVVERLESMAAEARITTLGETHYEKTKNLVIASFLHQSSRELDPQMHTHLAILNMTQRKDSQWRALSSREKNDVSNLYNGFREILYDNQHYFGLVYTSTLAKEVVKCGYDINRADKYGNFEISSVPPSLIKEFSKRSEDIKESLEQKEIVKNAKSAEIAALDTRKQKQTISSEALITSWLDTVDKQNIDLNEIVSESKSPTVKYPEQKVVSAVETSKLAAEAVQGAILHLSEFNSKIHHADIVRFAFEYGGTNVLHQELENEVDRLVSCKSLLKSGDNLYTSKHLVEKEAAFLEKMLKGNNRSFSIRSESKALQDKILSNSDRIQIINVLGTANERELLQGLVNSTEGSGKYAYILHPLKFQQNQLNRDLSHNNSSVWRRIKNLFRDDVIHSVSGFSSAYAHKIGKNGRSNNNDVIVVCDSQKLGFGELQELGRLSKQSNSKLILLNNDNSTQGYRAGNPIKSLKDAGVRQHQSKGASQKYECILNSSVNSINDISKKFFANYNLQKDTCVVALSKNEQLGITNNIRARLKENNIISKEEITIRTLSTTKLSEHQSKSHRFYSVGDLIIRNPYKKGQERLFVTEKSDRYFTVTNKFGDKERFDINLESNFTVQKAKKIDVSIGDKLCLDASAYIGRKKYEKGEGFHIKALSENGFIAENNLKEMFISSTDISRSSFSHDYVKRPHQLTKKYSEALLSAKSYQLNRQALGEISEYLKKDGSKIEIFTNDVLTSKKNLDKSHVKHTVQDALNTKKELPARPTSLLGETIEKDINTLYKQLSRPQSEKSIRDTANEAVNYALAKCHEREAAVLHKDLLTEALLYSLGKADCKDLIPILENRLKSGSLLYCDSLWINEKELKLEQNIVKLNREGQNKVKPLVSERSKLLSINSKLTQGQRDAVYLALTTKDRFITIQGLAGVGKTTMTKELKRFADEKSVQIIGITPTNKAKEELERQGIMTRTVASAILGEESFKPGTIFILDEASMVGNSDYHQIQKIVIKNNCSLITTGDRAQNQSISAGVPHELNQDTKSQKVAIMSDIVRQNANPTLKDAVYAASRGDIKKAHEKLQQIDQSKWVRRDTNQQSRPSVVEISPKYNEKTKTRDITELYNAIAKDFLTRTKECRDKTIVIAHANEDREKLNHLIRQGLQEKGEVNKVDFSFDRYLSKDMKDAEKYVVSSYERGDIIRFDANSAFAKAGDYYYVKEIDTQNNVLNCKNGDNHLKSLKLKDIKDSRFSVYQNKPNNISVGEKIRFKRTELSKGRTANDVYKVISVENRKVTVQRNNIIHCLDLAKEGDKHWDYAYTDTSYTIQGGTDRWVLSLELSFRKHATNWRSLLIDISRASHHHTSYTDDHNALIERTTDKKNQIQNDKKSAYLVYENYQKNLKTKLGQVSSERSLSLRRTYYKKVKPTIEEVGDALKSASTELCHHLLGEPNKALSTSNNLRYGRKGSLSIQVSRGLWKNFETNESGNLFGLIQSELGMDSFKDAINYAQDFLNMSERLEPVTRAAVTKDSSNSISKSQKTAKTLYKASKPIEGTIGEKYLNIHRGIAKTKKTSLRFLESCYTYQGGKKNSVPALLAPTYDEKGQLNNIQIIRLNPSDYNKDKLSNLKKQTFGSMNGYFCELNKEHNNGKTYVVEGVETGMSILEVKPKARVVVTFGVSNFKNIKFSMLSKEVCFCLDNDGEDTFKNHSIVGAITNAQKAGKDISFVRPNLKGNDLNDELLKYGKDAVMNTLNKEHEGAKFLSKYSEKSQLPSYQKPIVEQQKTTSQDKEFDERSL